ncbi:hypothetical protein BDD12DRAFT_557077 [Trichophaea hybrida]|nr:hypothetical protein BDD12DRAFT_557077 [Trichophaea hybrida]
MSSRNLPMIATPAADILRTSSSISSSRRTETKATVASPLPQTTRAMAATTLRVHPRTRRNSSTALSHNIAALPQLRTTVAHLPLGNTVVLPLGSSNTAVLPLNINMVVHSSSSSTEVPRKDTHPQAAPEVLNRSIPPPAVLEVLSRRTPLPAAPSRIILPLAALVLSRSILQPVVQDRSHRTLPLAVPAVPHPHTPQPLVPIPRPQRPHRDIRHPSRATLQPLPLHLQVDTQANQAMAPPHHSCHSNREAGIRVLHRRRSINPQDMVGRRLSIRCVCVGGGVGR